MKLFIFYFSCFMFKENEIRKWKVGVGKIKPFRTV
jgi:hypothetical protein